MSKYALCFVISGLLFCCGFEDTNTDPNRVTMAKLEELLPSAQTQLAHTRLAVPGRMVGVFMQHFQGVDDQIRDWTNYDIKGTDFDKLWSEGLYGGSMKDCKLLIDLATEENCPYYAGIAKVLMAQNLALVAIFWGDAPYSEAFSIEILTPVYDSQESLLHTVQYLLDDALSDFNSDPEVGFLLPQNDDLIYKGDIQLWIQMAYALKARYYVWLSKKDENSYAKALQALEQGGISAANEPVFTFSSTLIGTNPYALFGGGVRARTMYVHENFIRVLDERNDPRKNSYAVYDEIDERYTFYVDGFSGPYWGRRNIDLPLLSFAEQKFIEAEAWLTTDLAKSENCLYAAIEASMIQMQVDPATAQVYLDNYANFTNQITVQERLEHIITEKYIALFAQAEPETWVDFRRTGFPVLDPLDSDGNGANPSKSIPSRFLYPTNEFSTNRQQVEAAIQRQGLGTGLLDDKLWIFN